MYDRLLQLSVTPEKAPDEPTYIELGFEQGIPVSLNGEKLSPVGMLEELNSIGGKNGIGIPDIVENRLVGMKSGVYMKHLEEPFFMQRTGNWSSSVSTVTHCIIRILSLRGLPSLSTMDSGLRH